MIKNRNKKENDGIQTRDLTHLYSLHSLLYQMGHQNYSEYNITEIHIIV